MANELTIINRKDYTNAIKVFDADTRKAIDNALALGNDFARAHNDEAKRVNVARAIAVYHIAKDAEAVEKAGYKTFKDIAADLFGLAPANATNYRKAAEQFYCNADAPACKDWFGPSTLYLFCAAKVDNDTIKAAIEAGKIKADSTNDAIKAWIASLQSDALEDGKTPLAKLYDGTITFWNREENKTMPFYGQTLDEVKDALSSGLAGNAMPDEYFTVFNPHSTMTRVNPKGGQKDVAGKGLMLYTLDGVATAVYFPVASKKEKPAPAPSAQDAISQLSNMTPEQRAQILKMLSGGAYGEVADE